MNLITFKARRNGKLSEEILDYFNGAASYSLVMKLIRKKDVKINGRRTGKDEQIIANDEISVYAEITDERAEKTIYEDENVLVSIKPKGITSEDFYGLIKKKRENARFIHRLDRNTDGIMIFALNDTAEKELLKGFKDRTFKKYYITKAAGTFDKKEGTLAAYLIKNAEKAEVKIFDEPKKGSDKIITKYKVLSEEDGFSILEIELVTGKTHQIRAHLSHIGHPIIGDGKYGYKSINDKFKEKSQVLTAYKTQLFFDKESPLSYLSGKTFEITTPSI